MNNFNLAGTRDQTSLAYPDAYNVAWNFPSKNSAESMPVGGGDIGCNVWVEQGDLLVYMQRSGSFNELGEYVKLGRLRVRLTPNPFAEPKVFRQELKLEKGHIVIGALGRDAAPFSVEIRIWVEVARPVIHLTIEADQAVEVTVAFESWRLENRELKDGHYGERFGCFNVEGYPGKVTKLKDNVCFHNESVLFYHRNPSQPLIPGLLIEQQGLQRHASEIPDAISNRIFGGCLAGTNFVPAEICEGSYLATPFRSWSLRSRQSCRSHRLYVATHIAQTPDFIDWEARLLALVDTIPQTTLEAFDATLHWWAAFWKRSWISLFPDRMEPNSEIWQAGRNYNLIRYQLGCNAYGKFPTKFNGGNFTVDPIAVDKVADNPANESERGFDPDWRAWGGDTFTAQNQRLLYWPMLKAGDFDAMLPQFQLYQRGLAGALVKTKAHFGHEGALFCEHMNASGLDYGAGWGWPGNSHRKRGEELAFGHPSVNGLGGYGEPVELGVMANGAVSYHWEGQVEHAFMMLEYHRFTGDDIRPYLPFIEAALVFFDEHYQLRQKMRSGLPWDENGKLVLYPSTSCESYRGAKNPADLIAGLRSCLEGLLALDDNILPGDRKSYYRSYLGRLPDFNYDEIEGDMVLKPAETWLKYQNVECPQFYPLFPFNRFNRASPEIAIFRNTWKHGDFPKGLVESWHQDGIFFARMGMVNESAEYNVRKLQNSDRRFPTFWGPGHDWVPDLNWGGSGMIGLQEMLMQTHDQIIFLLPSWPKEWDVDFKLHAPYQTTVEAKVRGGRICELEVDPESRRSDVIDCTEAGVRKWFGGH
jgi:hypothetical protein